MKQQYVICVYPGVVYIIFVLKSSSMQEAKYLKVLSQSQTHTDYIGTYMCASEVDFRCCIYNKFVTESLLYRA